MKTIDEIQTEFVTAFNEIDDWMMQYEFLLQVGAELEPYPDKWRDDTHLIQGFTVRSRMEDCIYGVIQRH